MEKVIANERNNKAAGIVCGTMLTGALGPSHVATINSVQSWQCTVDSLEWVHSQQLEPSREYVCQA